jgi:hypothetical protein
VGLFAAVLASLALYDETSVHLWRAGVWWDVAWLAFVLIPATFALVLIALPLREARGLFLTGIAFAALAAVLTAADFDVPANFARLAAATLLAWWFLTFFEEASWVVLIACIIPGSGPARRRQPRRPRPPLLRALPRRRGPVRAARLADVRRAGRGARPDDRGDCGVRHQRPAGAPGNRARLPAAERRPSLAPPTRAARPR